MLLRFLSSQSPPISCFHREQSFLLFWPCAYNHRTRRSRSSSLNAVDKESQFEIDREKAREALQKLDEQLETLSQKQITPKKRLPSSLPPLGTLSLSLNKYLYTYTRNLSNSNIFVTYLLNLKMPCYYFPMIYVVGYLF